MNHSVSENAIFDELINNKNLNIETIVRAIPVLVQKIQFLEQENQKKDQRIEALEQKIQKDNAFFTKTLNTLVQKTSHLRDIIFSDLSLQKRLRSNSEWFYYYTESEAINILNANGIFMKGRNSRAPKKESLLANWKEKVKQRITSIRKPILKTSEVGKFLGIQCCPQTARRKMVELANAMPNEFELCRVEGKKVSWYLKLLKSTAVIW